MDADFSRARGKAFFRRMGARPRNEPDAAKLSCFEEVRRTLGARGGVRLGRRVVCSTDVVGSIDSEFDRTFLPAKASLETRWKRIDQAFHNGEELPPVSLYEIGDAYFVLDGNHRVSVTRYHGVEWIDAEVTRSHTRLRGRTSADNPMSYPREKGDCV